MSNVNHPQHYKDGQFECIDVMLDVFGYEAVQNFCQLNAFKYIWRAKNKNGLEDIQKAIWYLNKIDDLNCEGVEDMPYESNSDFEAFLGYVDEDGNIHKVEKLTDVPVVKTIFDVLNKKEQEEEPEEETTLAEDVANRAAEHYDAFLKVGFDENKAFALTRDWFKIEMEHIYDDVA